MRVQFVPVCVLLLAAPDWAAARDVTLSLLGGGQVVAGREFDPLAQNDALALMNIELGLELPELLAGFSLELGYEYGDKSAELFAGQQPWLTTGLQLHGLTASAVYRLVLAEWLAASVRVGGSLNFARLRLSTPDGPLLQDWVNARLGAFGTLGLELSLSRNLWRRWIWAICTWTASCCGSVHSSSSSSTRGRSTLNWTPGRTTMPGCTGTGSTHF